MTNQNHMSNELITQMLQKGMSVMLHGDTADCRVEEIALLSDITIYEHDSFSIITGHCNGIAVGNDCHNRFSNRMLNSFVHITV